MLASCCCLSLAFAIFLVVLGSGTLSEHLLRLLLINFNLTVSGNTFFFFILVFNTGLVQFFCLSAPFVVKKIYLTKKQKKPKCSNLQPPSHNLTEEIWRGVHHIHGLWRVPHLPNSKKLSKDKKTVYLSPIV